MIKELILPAIVGAVFGGGSVGAGVKFWADHTYVPLELHVHEHEILVASFDETSKRATEQTQIYALQNQIADIRRRAARQNRNLDQYELNDISELETKIDNLKGW